jgi:hypothetical protein
MASYLLSAELGIPRLAWAPVLTEQQAQKVRQDGEERPHTSSCMIAFHAGNVWSEEELASRLGDLKERFLNVELDVKPITATLRQMGETGQRYLG